MRALLGLCVVAALSGCGDDDASFDAGRDATMDTLVLDAPVGDASDADASFDAGMDASMPGCRGTCDPIEGICAEGACVLAAAVPMCVPEAGDLEEGTPCESDAACGPGLACFLKRELGVCGRICCPAEDTCAADERCGGTGILVSGVETGFRECLPPRPCNVLDADACEPMEACYVVSSEGDTDCRRAGDAELGEECVEPNDCAPGLLCAGFFEQTCQRVCELGEEGSCRADEGMCIAYAQSPPGTGICTPDMSPPP